MDLKAKIELIEILQKKLFKNGTHAVATGMTEEEAERELKFLKEKVIAVAKEAFETAESKKRTKQYLKHWCKHHKLDYSVLEL